MSEKVQFFFKQQNDLKNYFFMIESMIIYLACIVLGLWFTVKLLWIYITRPWCNFITVPLNEYPILGHVPGLLSMSESQFFKKHLLWLTTTKTKTKLMWVGCRHILMTADIKVFERVLSSPKLITKSSSYWIFKDWLGQSLFTSTGSFWQHRRKMLTPSFHFSIMNDSSRIMDYYSKNLVSFLQNHGNIDNGIDVFKLMKTHSIGVIYEAAFGLKNDFISNALHDEQCIGDNSETIDFIRNIDRLLILLFKRDEVPFYWFNNIFKWLPEGMEFYNKLKLIEGFCLNAIKKRIKLFENTDGVSNENKHSIFIDRLISSYQKGELDMKDVLNETQTFLFAGYDTVATALSWCMFMLGSHPEVQAKALKEAEQIKEQDLPIQDGLKEMKFIECVIKETLRIHPSAPMISRNVDEAIEIDSVVYPKNSAITLAILAMHRNPSIWEDPLEFIPERFLAGSVHNKPRSPYSFVPFSAGSRNCIGQKFAMMELKITVYHLLLNFEIVALQKVDELQENICVVHGIENKEGLKILFKPRKKVQ